MAWGGIKKIVSGGQTGGDRAGLDFAIKMGIPHGGWCPKGRKAEDGAIPETYMLIETPSANYLQRTEWNVRDSDATVIFTMAGHLSGGSKRTAEFAAKHRKPCLHLPRHGGSHEPVLTLQRFVEANNVAVLNVAGSRASKEPELWKWAFETLEAAVLHGSAHRWIFGGLGYE